MKTGLIQTKREQKHDMLLAFMANAKPRKTRHRSAPLKPRLLKALFSLFI